MRVTNNNIFDAISSIVKPGSTISWGDIVAAVNAAGMVVPNWLKVRGVLQFMINKGTLTRTADIHNEDYICK